MYFFKKVNNLLASRFYILLNYVRFEVLKAVKTSLLFLWIATPCGLVGR
jgi:hypothetical protein